MGRFAEVSKKVKDNRKSFEPIELTEGNVQAIFEGCLADLNCVAGLTGEHSSAARLFPPEYGYQRGDEVAIQFDPAKLRKNKKTIEYLFGQVQDVHTHKLQALTIDDYNTTYSGTHWTNDKVIMMKFLYLGVTYETQCVTPFLPKSGTAIISSKLKPTLSPKDPAFPEWWEKHKAEWED